jgi:hypothetical protein
VVQDAVAPIGDHVYELDQMFVRPGPAGLDLGIGGNLPAGWAGLALFVDAQPGGQSTLATASFPVPPYGPQALSGLTFDAGFTPERLLYLNEYQGVLYADLFTLATGGGGSKRYLGSRAVGSAGVAGGGDNPNGLRIGYSGGNRAGVSPTSAALAATATDGFRLHLPWPDLGLPAGGGPLSLLAMLMDNDGQVRSQMLPGIGSAASPGYPPFDLGAIAGQQYFVLPAAVGVGPEGAPMVAMTVGPNPVRGALRVEFALSRADDAMLEVVDVAGRRAVRRALTGLAVGTHRVVLDEVAELPAGLWFVRLRVGGSTHARRVMVVR